MVFYFSATGNSAYVAEKIKKTFGGKMLNIADAMKNNVYEYTVKDEEKVFFIFPVYFYGIPNLVLTFLENIRFTGGTPEICGIATCGSAAGGTDAMFRKALKPNGYDVKGFYKIKMVDNYILLFKVVLKEEQIMRLRRADKELAETIDAIKFNFRTSYKSSVLTRIASKTAYSFYHGKCGTMKFWTTDTCSGCGLCQTACPIDAIQMTEGRPVWVKDQCVHCLGCINKCPEESIQYGKNTEKKGRYVNPLLK